MFFLAQNALKADDASNSPSTRILPILNPDSVMKSHRSSSGFMHVSVGVAHMKLMQPATNS
eukprot:3578927-Rhodomonas_salina.1